MHVLADLGAVTMRPPTGGVALVPSIVIFGSGASSSEFERSAVAQLTVNRYHGRETGADNGYVDLHNGSYAWDDKLLCST